MKKVIFNNIFDFLYFDNKQAFEVHNTNFEAHTRILECVFPLNLN